MKIRTQLIAGFSLMAFLVILMQTIDFQSNQASQDAEDWAHHTYTVIAKTEKIGKLMLDMETGERGFLITGDEAFMEPYNQASTLYAETMAELQTLVSDNPSQVQRLEDIEKLIARWNEEVALPLMQKRKAASVEASEKAAESMAEIRAIVSSSAGKKYMDQIRQKIADIIAVEQVLLENRNQKTASIRQQNQIILFGGTLLFLFFAVTITIIITRTIYEKVGGEPAAIAAITNRIAKGNLEVEAPTGRETGILATVNLMLESLKKNQKKINNQNWLNEGIAGLDDTLRGTKTMDLLCEDIITYIARYLEVQVGTVSLVNSDGSKLALAASYAYKGGPNARTEFRFGEGLIGQAAQEKKRLLLKNVPENGITITSALGEITPGSIVCLPLLHEGSVNGVIELGTLHTFTDLQLKFLDQTAERIAIAIHSAHSRERLKVLLEESQAQAEELQAQQEDLKTANEELEEKSQELETQQEELRVSNEELEEKNAELQIRSEEAENENGER